MDGGKGRDEVLQVVVSRRASSGDGSQAKDETYELLPRSPLRRTLSDAAKVDCKVLYARLSMGGDASLSTITEVQEQADSGEHAPNDSSMRIYNFSSSSEEISLCSSPSHSSQRNPETSSASDATVTSTRSNVITTSAVINQPQSDREGLPRKPESHEQINENSGLLKSRSENNNDFKSCRQRQLQAENNQPSQLSLVSIETSL